MTSLKTALSTIGERAKTEGRSIECAQCRGGGYIGSARCLPCEGHGFVAARTDVPKLLAVIDKLIEAAEEISKEEDSIDRALKFMQIEPQALAILTATESKGELK